MHNIFSVGPATDSQPIPDPPVGHFGTFLKITRTSGDGFVLLDRALRVIDKNASADRICLGALGDLAGGSVQQLFPASDQGAVKQLLEELLRNPGASPAFDIKLKPNSSPPIDLTGSLTNLLDDADIGALLWNFREAEKQNSEAARPAPDEQRFEALIENSSDGIVIFDRDRKPLYVSSAFERILGYTIAEIKGRNSYEVMHPDDRATVAAAMKNCLSNAGSPVKNVIFRMRHKNGQYVRLNATLTNFLHVPSIRGIVSNFRNITEETVNLNTLTEIKTELEKIMISSLDMICSVDAEGRIIRISSAAERILGYSPAELVGHYLFDFIHPEDRERTIKKVEWLMKDNEIINFENRYLRRDGSIVYLSWSSKWDAINKVRYGVARDITDKKQSEAELVVSEAKYRTLFDNNPLPLFFWEFDTLRFVDCNQAVVDKYGYTKEEFLRLTIKDTWPDDSEPVNVNHIIDRIEHDRVFEITRQHKKKNGEVILVEIRAQLINFNGKNMALAMANDVTESHYYSELDKLERNILAENALSEAVMTDVIGDYLAGMEQLHPGMYCAMLRNKDNRLQTFAVSGIRGEWLSEINGAEITANTGPCARAILTKEKVIVPEIANSDFSDNYKRVAGANQLKSCWSLPVIDSTGEVMAVFACYYKQEKCPTKLEQKTIERAVNILAIILEKQQADLALQLSNDRFERVAEATFDVIWDWNVEAGTVFYSDNFKKGFGYEAGVSHGADPLYKGYIHPDDTDRVNIGREVVKNSLTAEWNEVYRFKKADGEYATVRNRAAVIRNANGHISRIVGAMTDISKQKAEEQHLKLLESVVTNTTDAVLITDARAKDEFGPTILYVNEAFTSMAGYEPQEIIGKSPGMLLGPKTDLAELKRCMEAVSKSQPINGTILNYKKNGEEYWKNFSIVPVNDESGQCTHLVAIERDVTKQRTEELQKRLLTEVSRIFNQTAELNIALLQVLERIIEFGEFCFGEFWLVDTDKKHMTKSVHYGVKPLIVDFLNQTEAKTFKKGQGGIGMAWEFGKTISWNAEFVDKRFERAKAAKQAGLTGGCSIPLIYNDQVIGVLTLGFDQHENVGIKNISSIERLSGDLGVEVQRKQLENELNQIFHFTPDILCIAHINGYFKKVNPAMSALLEYDEDELLSIPFMDLVYNADKARTVAELDNIVNGSPTYYIENRYVSKSGKIKWLAWTTTGASHEGIIYCAAKDVTEKKNLEDLLGKATRLARIGAWDIDIATGIVNWSDMTREIHEAEPGVYPGISDAHIYYKNEEDFALFTKTMEDARVSGVPGDMELQMTTAKGNKRWVRVIVESEFTDGQCTKLYGSFQDIDERKRAELVAQTLLEEKSTILDSIGDAFFTVDKDWTVTYWNKMAEKLFSIPRIEVVGKTMFEAFPHWVGSKGHHKYSEAFDTRQPIHFEQRGIKTDAWLETSVYPTDHGLTAYVKDITERKTTEIHLKELNTALEQHARDLAISNEELEQFAYVASHDLQEPLRMVTSFVKQLELKYSDIVDDRGRQYIHFAVDGATRMRRIILDLLEFSKIGKTRNEEEDVDLNALIGDVIALHRKQIEELKASIEFGDLPILRTGRTQLLQVFQNLIGNSLKYHRADETPHILVSCTETASHFQFSVTDNGIGISPEYFAKIFVIFQRLHNQAHYSGTGIGLAITKKIVENLGGKIWLTSEEGKGTTFYFTILKQKLND